MLSETLSETMNPSSEVGELQDLPDTAEDSAEYQAHSHAPARPDLSAGEPVALDPYAQVIVRLLQGEIYEDEKIWGELLEYRIPINEYFGRIGLEVIIDQREGFAFLRQLTLDDSGRTIGLIKRTPLSYEVTLLLVLLRELLENYELQDTTSPACFVSHQKIREELELFFKDTSNKIKLFRKLDHYIRQVMDLGFLKLVQDTPENRQYEIRRILKAKIGPDVLEDVRRKMESYAN